MKSYNFVILMMVFISVRAMEHSNKQLNVAPLPLPDIHEKYSKPWIESLTNWAQCYYRAKALYENAIAYQKKDQAEGKSGKSSDSGLLIMQWWLQWCQSKLKEIIDDPDALIGYPIGRRFLEIALASNKFCLGKLLNANPCLKSEYICHPLIFHAKDLKWAKLFASSIHFKPDILDDADRNLIMRATDYDCPEELLKFYLDKKIDPHFANSEGNALHALVNQTIYTYGWHESYDVNGLNQQLKKAELLIQKGVNINHINEKGDTPLNEINDRMTMVHNLKLQNSIIKSFFEAMKTLYCEHGAKTAKELSLKKRKFNDDIIENVD